MRVAAPAFPATPLRPLTEPHVRPSNHHPMPNHRKSEKRCSRRKFVKWGLAGLAGAVVAERGYDYLSESKAKAKIVIVGGGAAGITLAAYLADWLRYDDITIIEPNEKHHYQPGYTLIAGGVFTPEEIVKPTTALIPKQVKWLQSSVAELNPDNNYVVTANNEKIAYDFLVLVPGCQMDFNLVQGISRATLGEGNAHCIYDFNGAKACWEALKKLPDLKEGRLLFTNTYTKLKCGGAPKKICLMAEDYLRDRNLRDNFKFDYFANQNELMKPKIFGDRLTAIFKERKIAINYRHRLAAVDTSAKQAVFDVLPEPSPLPVAPEAKVGKVTVDYDFLHFVPPMSAPDFVKNSDLTDKSAPGGWIKVDKETLVHATHKNIISFGDAAGLPTSKTGAAIRMQAPIAAANLIALMEQREPTGKYNGYSACPIITEYGKILMCEFGYDEKLMPTIPWLNPGIERGMWWTLKVHGLKPMYYQGMLKGLL
jgi:sulfide:quinone oxidoreductase